ncbi:PLDc N-terminal domain-containing protein [Jonesia denitrificans]|uniref:Cardiolipin synthase N-terminal domain-containing protein n=1 Tax=Jonesia denitrificans (strain ATCC 14870 / DSM 20603 / BCRC 15368 / CIP 55.134 / JCM 11481 / NBRC 15587 / NCTC 10816 / Prevot 55134) TaxID=471856 RepID=C7R4J2_JONDD|nr:PLDc N-terminal domain-containing protein [Jonesia denitrificans]ACV09049.1 conserved hypothetical protein [Jonesia denitrificans DSM 20603]ASE09657.1 hypothetical protein CEP80_11345 [Jonesia denitrificans]QXB44196.1 PLDc N-terminal domain-containing protein [Jonesia denitrificans]SQH21197.1 Uncharacterised protein [Jonesia denitrificans]
MPSLSFLVFGIMLPLVGLGLWAWALYDLVRTPIDKLSTKVVWFIIVVVGNMVGSVVWLIWGRRDPRSIERL